MEHFLEGITPLRLWYIDFCVNKALTEHFHQENAKCKISLYILILDGDLPSME